jgi:predicted O-methyltransferase YrrM/DNA-binding CsgD family transcriptional regulator
MPLLPDNLAGTLRAFQESRILLSALELDVFTAVGDGATASETAARMGANPRATEMLLNALVALDALTKHDGVFRNTAAAAEHFVEGAPSGGRLSLMHYVNLWNRWSRLTDCVRRGTAVDLVDLEERGEEWIAAFIAAMQRHSQEGAPALVADVDASGARRMLDVGGGSGAYSIAFAQANPSLHAVIFDLEPVLAIAQTHIDRAGLTARVTTRVGDLHTDAFGGGFDMVLISSICHMLSPQEILDLFRKSFAALNPAGRVIVRDFILEDGKTAPRQAAVFSLNMLVGTRGGSNYSTAEYRELLEQAGFAGVHPVELPTPASLMIGAKP